MKMNLNQTKLVGLTMELNLKTIEYKKLCEELDELEKEGVVATSSRQQEEKDERLTKLKESFEKNQEEIQNINKQLEELNAKDGITRPQETKLNELPNYLSEHAGENTYLKENNTETSIAIQNKGLLKRIMERIKKILNK